MREGEREKRDIAHQFRMNLQGMGSLALSNADMFWSLVIQNGAICHFNLSSTCLNLYILLAGTEFFRACWAGLSYPVATSLTPIKSGSVWKRHEKCEWYLKKKKNWDISLSPKLLTRIITTCTLSQRKIGKICLGSILHKRIGITRRCFLSIISSLFPIALFVSQSEESFESEESDIVSSQEDSGLSSSLEGEVEVTFNLEDYGSSNFDASESFNGYIKN